MLAAAGPLKDTSALVLAQPGLRSLEVLCGLIRQGCAAAAEVAPDRKVPIESAEIVIIPNLTSRSAIQAALSLAQRCLLPCGRIVLQDGIGNLSREIVEMLRVAGFCKICVQALATTTIISADKPMYGPMVRVAGHA